MFHDKAEQYYRHNKNYTLQQFEDFEMQKFEIQ